jgi:predicted transcriptional regulator
MLPHDRAGTTMAATIEIDDDLKEQVDALAKALDRSPASLLSEAVRQFLDRQAVRSAFLQEAEASWADYQATGLHLTGAETRAWLARWGDEADAEPPECHV